MPTMNGVIKDQTGDELLPRTSFAQVRDEDEKLLSDWRAETDEAVSDLQAKDTELEESIAAVQDAIPDVSNLSALTSAELEESSLAAGGTEAGDFTFTISFKDAIAGWSDPVSVTVNGNVNESISFTASIEYGKTVGGLPMGQVNYKGEYNGVTAEGYAGTGQIGLDFGTSGYATITSRNLNAAGTGYDLEGTFISYVGYKAGAFLTLTSTSADGATSAITVDLSSLKHTSGLGINIGSDGAISVDETFLSSLLGQLVTQTSFAELEARVAALESGE